MQHLLLLLLWMVALSSANPPDIIFILSDDQDLTLGSLKAMPKLLDLIGNEGATFTNAFATTPVCCPSRASIYTGLYQHNTRVWDNEIAGNCDGDDWINHMEPKTFNVALEKAGYRTSFAGKYLNTYFTTSVPPGWTDWLGLHGNSVYYEYMINNNGRIEYHGSDYSKDYLTDVISNHSINFLTHHYENHGDQPVYAVLSVPASHDPDTPAPQYETLFADLKAPRTPNFDYRSHGQAEKHWLVNYARNPMSNSSVNTLDDMYRNRLRTLVSVDDMVERVYQLVKQYNRMENTFIIYASDNGFHLGQFSLPYDKRFPYESDIRVPLFIRGPGIQPGTTFVDAVLSIDIAPTIVDLATGKPPSTMDGKSFAPLLRNSSNNFVSRNDFLVEYRGEYVRDCLGGLYSDCCTFENLFHHWCIDSINNTYTCLRSLNTTTNSLYCEFKDNINFKEYYNLTSDPWQLNNMALTVPESTLAPLVQRMNYLSTCHGTDCNTDTAS